MNDYDAREQRENMMQRRLRKARGEEVSDELAADQDFDDFDDPRAPGMGYDQAPPYPRARRRAGGGSGCAQAVLYLTIGALVALVIGIFVLNQFASRIGQFFAGVPALPDVATLIATPTPQIITSAAVVQRVQQLSRLETASYSIQTVIDVRQGSNIPVVGDFLEGDALLLIAHGTVIAGVDLNTLTTDDVTVAADGRSVTLRLPPAMIFATTLDNERTRVYSRSRGIFAPENKDLETEARRQAEQQILLAACEDGVLSKATEQAQASLTQLVGLFDNVAVTVVPAPPGPCPAP
ncbi:MAG: DUF4230 domain-containing protein [Chloroflexia bacterium]|nr:DUF4230 domain-containing protein [Chloroflexia bacterium]